MNAKREEICRKCSALPTFKEPVLSCKQPYYPIDEDEWQRLGVKPEDEITPEKLELMMEISTRPYCKARMLAAHPIQWWYEQIEMTK